MSCSPIQAQDAVATLLKALWVLLSLVPTWLAIAPAQTYHHVLSGIAPSRSSVAIAFVARPPANTPASASIRSLFINSSLCDRPRNLDCRRDGAARLNGAGDVYRGRAHRLK